MCLALGVAHPDYLLDEISASQYDDWLAFFESEPWGQDREDARQAVLIQHLLRPHLKNPNTTSDLPKYQWPYFETDEDKASDWRRQYLWQKATIANTVHDGEKTSYKVDPQELWNMVMEDGMPIEDAIGGSNGR